jgi:ribulose 1,5-bisphosphate synthetase/thiazole synthase
MRLRAFCLITALGCGAVLSECVCARAQAVLNPQEAAKIVSIEDVRVSPTGVSGAVVNRTPISSATSNSSCSITGCGTMNSSTGNDSPGHTVVQRMNKELQPGESAPFSHTLNVGGDRKDGRFVPEATVAAFAVVVPPK